MCTRNIFQATQQHQKIQGLFQCSNTLDEIRKNEITSREKYFFALQLISLFGVTQMVACQRFSKVDYQTGIAIDVWGDHRDNGSKIQITYTFEPGAQHGRFVSEIIASQ